MNRIDKLTRILIAGLALFTFLGATAFLGRDATYLSFAPAPTATPTLTPSPAPICGLERWAVKTGTDSDARLVDLNSSKPTTIADLIKLQLPSSLPENKRIAPTENTVWVITATLTGFKLEDDHDYHLVLSDEKNNTMIAEIPDPNCIGGNSPFRDQMKSVRSKFEAKLIGSKKPQSTFRIIQGGIPVQITGVGFFDKLHGQRGVAPNGIELHPVLDIVFNPPSLPAAKALPSISDVNDVKWEYLLVTAKSAEELQDQLNSVGEEGWELVNVIVDPRRPDSYVAYLKRQKE